MIDERRLQEIRERTNKATPGYWYIKTRLGGRIYTDSELRRPRGVPGDWDLGRVNTMRYGWREDAEFIAHAREDIAWLLNMVIILESHLTSALVNTSEHIIEDCNEKP